MRTLVARGKGSISSASPPLMPVVRVPLVPLNQSSTLAINTGNTERLTRLVLIGFSSNAKTTARCPSLPG